METNSMQDHCEAIVPNESIEEIKAIKSKALARREPLNQKANLLRSVLLRRTEIKTIPMSHQVSKLLLIRVYQCVRYLLSIGGHTFQQSYQMLDQSVRLDENTVVEVLTAADRTKAASFVEEVEMTNQMNKELYESAEQLHQYVQHWAQTLVLK